MKKKNKERTRQAFEADRREAYGRRRAKPTKAEATAGSGGTWKVTSGGVEGWLELVRTGGGNLLDL